MVVTEEEKEDKEGGVALLREGRVLSCSTSRV